jgi:hypothetical protein
VEKPLRVLSRCRRKPIQCNGNEAEEDLVCAQIHAEKDPASPDSEETLHETDSEFVPSTAECETDENSTSCASDSVSCTCTEIWDVEELPKYVSVEEATTDLEELIANQV